MEKPKSNLDFTLMALAYKLRDLRLPRMNILNEAGIKEGSSVLDYGCGPGSYITPLVKLVGESGKVYALDVHPLAVKKVRTTALRKGLSNVAAIQSDCRTGLENKSVDAVLLYDIFHDLSNPDEVLEELHRILKPDGILSFSDHHLKESEIVLGVTDTGLFGLKRKGQRTYSFSPQKADTY
jgi:ubiquinone/menaquinone biosynthesis C-methylase UbiE